MERGLPLHRYPLVTTSEARVSDRVRAPDVSVPAPPAPPAPAASPVEALPGNARWWVLVTIGIGTFMSALDGSAVNTLLPVLGRELGTDVAGLPAVVRAGLLAVAALAALGTIASATR